MKKTNCQMSSVSDSPSFRTYIYNDNRYLPMLYLYSTPMHMYTQLHSLGQKLIFGPSLISALICADGRNWAITYKIIRGITKICYLTREIDIPIIVDYLLDTHSMMMSMHTLQISCIRLLSKREMVHNNANLFWRTFFKICTIISPKKAIKGGRSTVVC